MLKNILFKWRKHISFLAICFLWTSVSQAQTSANSSGGTVTSNGGSLDYSVGKLVYTTIDNSQNNYLLQIDLFEHQDVYLVSAEVHYRIYKAD
jgi:hypothetical protein